MTSVCPTGDSTAKAKQTIKRRSKHNQQLLITNARGIVDSAILLHGRPCHELFHGPMHQSDSCDLLKRKETPTRTKRLHSMLS